jgi:hypothetical protein
VVLVVEVLPVQTLLAVYLLLLQVVGYQSMLHPELPQVQIMVLMDSHIGNRFLVLEGLEAVVLMQV